MSILLGDNFSYSGAKPLDGRIKYDTLATMKAMADSTLYDGCMAYCVATEKNYQWKSANTVDETLGKWRELETGGSSGGHTIEDPEGTALTQRDTLQFGGDLEVSDDDENEKTVVAPHELTAAELTEIVTPLPSVPVNMPILFDETGTERVVGWYRLANGTKKPVYEKTFIGITGMQGTDSILGTVANIGEVFNISGICDYPNGIKQAIPCAGVYLKLQSGSIQVFNDNESFANKSCVVTARYTKTTDTPT